MNTSRRTLYYYWRHAREYRGVMARAIAGLTAVQFSQNILIPLLTSRVLNDIAAGNISGLTNNRLLPILIIIFGLEVFQLVMWRVVVRIIWRFEEQVKKDLTMTTFDHLLRQSYRFFADRFAGSLVNYVSKFVSSFERFTDAMFFNVLSLVIIYVFAVVVLAGKAPLIVWLLVMVTLIYVPVTWRVRREQIGYNARWAAAESKRTGQLADTISNVMAVKAFAGESVERIRMLERVDEVYSRSTETMSVVLRHEYYTQGINRAINIGAIAGAVLLARSGTIAVGDAYLVLNYTTHILRQLWDLSNTFRQFTRVFGDASDMTEILDITADVNDSPQPKPLAVKQGGIVFDDVVFAYPEQKTDAFFADLNLTIKPGERLGLVGTSGGGKTTVTKLLLRFMDLTGGRILIDGQSIADIPQADLRQAIAYVPQEPLLFHRSIAENIRYGKPDASDEEVVQAAIQANADEFVSQLPDGYETLVGERGVKLSGGQKQRVAIARALLKDAPILVLDEATSALDSESEKLIQDALWKLMEGRTAIVIAHRLSTVQKMDRIVVLEDGDIAEEGTHKQLVKRKSGVYARLWAHQSGGFISD